MATVAGSASPASPVAAVRPGTPGEVCRVTRGPIQLSLTGPVTLMHGAGNGDPRIVFNRDGVARAVSLPAKSAVKAADAGSERLALGEPAERASYPACAAAGGLIFCGDKSGGIHRSRVTADGIAAEGAVVAQARPGSPLAAATIAGDHVVYAFLADRKTAEGTTTLAFAGLDDATPILLSEDGSGATFVSLASRGEQVLAMYVDARRVLTPVHARVLTAGGKLGLGTDAVVFVGSGTDGRSPAAIAQGANGNEYALLPMDKDDRTFGLAAMRIEEQPHDDATTVWSPYPSAMDRPAIAATQGAWPIHVLRSAPAAAQAPGKLVLELGQLDAAGVWKPLCSVAEGTAFADLSMLVDRTGALWIAYTDAEGTWIERRGR